jgi:hypothetical protein
MWLFEEANECDGKDIEANGVKPDEFMLQLFSVLICEKY